MEVETGRPAPADMEPAPVWVEVGRPLCRALGLNPAEILSLELKCVAGELPTVTVVRNVRGYGEKIATAVECFRLEPVSSTPGQALDQSACLNSEFRIYPRPEPSPQNPA
jgi:hypothetical protein